MDASVQGVRVCRAISASLIEARLNPLKYPKKNEWKISRHM